MRSEKTVRCMREKLAEIEVAIANQEYRAFLSGTVETLDWVLGD